MTTQDKLPIVYFDTTLRDGEQSPGVTLSVSEKLDIARQLSKLGIDVLEAGFPIASEGDFQAVHAIATQIGPLTEGRKDGKPMVICGLSRAVIKDINRCYAAIEPAPRKRIHTFLATSDIHLQYKLKITREQCVEQAVAAVKHAKSLCEEVEFSPEDSGRSDKDFLCKVLSAVIEAGATTLNIPDTVGYNTPQEYFDIISYLIKNTAGSDKVIWSTHCHNDLGLATANTLAGVSAGARQVEVTINGIGERAGNTSFEEVAMTLFVHPDRYPVTSTHIDTTQIYSVSKLVSQYTGMAVQSNKAIVGANAFAHESGIHQDGVLKHQQTYEIISPATVGVPSNSLVLGKHSGRNAFKTHLAEMGYKDLSDEQIQATFTRFKALADSKKKVTDQDLVALLEDQVRQPEQIYKLGALQVTSANENNATATVSILKQVGGGEHFEEFTDAAVGNGPVDAIFKAIMRIIGLQFQLQYFEVKSVTEDTDALGTSVVKIIPITPSNGLGSSDSGVELDQQTRLNKSSPPTFRGQGTDPDILRASAKAYIHAVNRVIAEKENVNSPRYIGQGP